MADTIYATVLKMGIHYAKDDILQDLRRDCLNVAASLIWNSKDEEEFQELCKWWKEGISGYARDYEKENQLYLDLQNKVFEFSKYTFKRKFPPLITLKDILWPP